MTWSQIAQAESALLKPCVKCGPVTKLSSAEWNGSDRHDMGVGVPLHVLPPTLLTGTWFCGNHGDKFKDSGWQNHREKAPACVWSRTAQQSSPLPYIIRGVCIFVTLQQPSSIDLSGVIEIPFLIHPTIKNRLLQTDPML